MSIPEVFRSKHAEIQPAIKEELAKWRNFTGYEYTWHPNYTNLLKYVDSYYHTDVPRYALDFLSSARWAVERICEIDVGKKVFNEAINTRKIIFDIDPTLGYSCRTEIKNGILTYYCGPNMNAQEAGADIQRVLDQMRSPSVGSGLKDSSTFWQDTRLPLSQRTKFKQYEGDFKKNFDEMQRVCGSGPWTMEADVGVLYDMDKEYPVEYFASQMCEIVSTLAINLGYAFDRNGSLRQKFNAETKNHKIVVQGDKTMEDHIKSEFKNGDLIINVRDFHISVDPGLDIEQILETKAARSSSPGTKLTKEMANFIQEDILRGRGEKSLEAVRTIVQLQVTDIPLTSTHDYPLFCLINYKRADLVDELLKGVQNPNIKDEEGMTPLILACYLPLTKNRYYFMDERASQIGFIQALLEHPKTDVNAQDRHGRTALMYVAQSGDWDDAAESLLADKRLNANFENKKMETALEFAEESGFTWLAKVLNKRKNETANTAVSIASPPNTVTPKLAQPKAAPSKVHSTPTNIPISSAIKSETISFKAAPSNADKKLLEAKRLLTKYSSAAAELHLDIGLIVLSDTPDIQVEKIQQVLSQFQNKTAEYDQEMKSL